jgi:dTDP-4-amino-4,6-dideoxygalactose transaminase
MIVTNEDEIARRARILRDQGKASFDVNFHTDLGYNWRLSEIHALIGRLQLMRLGQFIENRRKIAATYDHLLGDGDILRPLREAPGVYSNYYKYIVLLDRNVDRNALKKILREKFGIALSGEVYSLPCHQQPIFRHLGVSLPVAERLCNEHICLPISASMSVEQAEYVVSSLKEACEKWR